jgi:hypothetical protein
MEFEDNKVDDSEIAVKGYPTLPLQGLRWAGKLASTTAALSY